ncbi:MAG: hypothetical protein WBA51_16565, partial [Erythrobacter sp.]
PKPPPNTRSRLAKAPANSGTPWFVAGAILSLAASALHIAVIAGGPKWYRFFGAPESYAIAASRGSIMPAIATLGIASVLALWAAFAFSGAGLIRRLPLLRTALVSITAIYLLRGALLIPTIIVVPYPEGAFDYWSSAIVLVYGVVHAVGLWKAWPSLRPSIR